jgi:predicted site-specific integrase-resolvase
MRTPHLRAVSAPQTLQVAIYARVSSDQQAEHHTIDSQLAELTARVARTATTCGRICGSSTTATAAPA